MMMMIPIIALIAVPRPFSAVSSLPAEVIYQKPPIIKKSTAIPKAIPNNQLITILIKLLKSVAVQFKPFKDWQPMLLVRANEAKGATVIATAKITSAIFR